MTVEKLLEQARGRDEMARLEAIRQLGHAAEPEDAAVVAALSAACSDPTLLISVAARRALDDLAKRRKESARDVTDAQPTGPAAAPPPLHLERFESYLTYPDDREVRLKAVTLALDRGAREALPLLLSRLDAENDVFVLSKLTKAVGTLGGLDVLPRLIPFLEHPDNRVRANTVEGLATIQEEEVFRVLVTRLEDPDGRVRANIVRALKGYRDFDPLVVLARMVASEAARDRASALHVLSRMTSPRVVEVVEPLLEHPDPRTREGAWEIIDEKGVLVGERIADDLEAIAQRRPDLRERVLRAAGRIEERAGEALAARLWTLREKFAGDARPAAVPAPEVEPAPVAAAAEPRKASGPTALPGEATEFDACADEEVKAKLDDVEKQPAATALATMERAAHSPNLHVRQEARRRTQKLRRAVESESRAALQKKQMKVAGAVAGVAALLMAVLLYAAGPALLSLVTARPSASAAPESDASPDAPAASSAPPGQPSGAPAPKPPSVKPPLPPGGSASASPHPSAVAQVPQAASQAPHASPASPIAQAAAQTPGASPGSAAGPASQGAPHPGASPRPAAPIVGAQTTPPTPASPPVSAAPASAIVGAQTIPGTPGAAQSAGPAPGTAPLAGGPSAAPHPSPGAGPLAGPATASPTAIVGGQTIPGTPGAGPGAGPTPGTGPLAGAPSAAPGTGPLAGAPPTSPGAGPPAGPATSSPTAIVGGQTIPGTPGAAPGAGPAPGTGPLAGAPSAAPGTGPLAGAPSAAPGTGPLAGPATAPPAAIVGGQTISGAPGAAAGAGPLAGAGTAGPGAGASAGAGIAGPGATAGTQAGPGSPGAGASAAATAFLPGQRPQTRLTQVATLGSFALSPFGERVAAARESTLTLTIPEPPYGPTATTSPSAGHVVSQTAREIVVTELASAAESVVSTAGPAHSPVFWNKSLAWLVGPGVSGALWFRNSRGARPLTDGMLVSHPTLAPGALRVCLQINAVDPQERVMGSDVAMLDLNSHHIATLQGLMDGWAGKYVTTTAQASLPAISPDGLRVAYISQEPKGPWLIVQDLASLKTAGGPIADEVRELVWPAESDHLIALVRSGDTTQLESLDPNAPSAAPRVLVSRKGKEAILGFAVDPTARRIVLATGGVAAADVRPETAGDLWLADGTGAIQEHLTRDGTASQPALSETGALLAFRRAEPTGWAIYGLPLDPLPKK